MKNGIIIEIVNLETGATRNTPAPYCVPNLIVKI
jgi:hypothetical protein